MHERVFGHPRLRCVFSISTVASSTRIPTARAIPPRVITLIVWPSSRESNRSRSEWRAESKYRQSTYCASFPGTAGSSAPLDPAAIDASRSTSRDRCSARKLIDRIPDVILQRRRKIRFHHAGAPFSRHPRCPAWKPRHFCMTLSKKSAAPFSRTMFSLNRVTVPHLRHVPHDRPLRR